MIIAINIFTFLLKSLAGGSRELRAIVIEIQRKSCMKLSLVPYCWRGFQPSTPSCSLVEFCSLKDESRGRSNSTELKKRGNHYVDLMMVLSEGVF